MAFNYYTCFVYFADEKITFIFLEMSSGKKSWKANKTCLKENSNYVTYSDVSGGTSQKEHLSKHNILAG